MKVKMLALCLGVVLCSSLSLFASKSISSSNQPNVSMPIPFTKNMGQWPDSILFRASTNGATMWFTKNGIWYQFSRRVEKADASATAIDSTNKLVSTLPDKFGHERDSIETTMIKAGFVGASESVEVVGVEELEYKCNYFIGNEPDKWRTDVPNYSAITMHDLYPGVSVTFVANDGKMQSQITSLAESALSQAKVEYLGVTTVYSDVNGCSKVQTPFGERLFNGVLLTEEITSKTERLIPNGPLSSSGVQLTYSTYLGGDGVTGSGDGATDITVSEDGSAYLTGQTGSASFPTQNAFQGSLIGGVYPFNADAFVSKLSSEGSELIYSTYLGGYGFDQGEGIAIDSAGCAYLTGWTLSTDFPSQIPLQNSIGSDHYDGFVSKLSDEGNGLLFSTFIGASSYDVGYDIALDLYGNCYVTGATQSPDFPVQNGLQSTIGGYFDAFIYKIRSTGTELIFSTFLGGSNTEYGLGVAVNAAGNAYVVGETNSTTFPTQNPLQPTLGGQSDVFVSKLYSSGDSLIYSTYLGGQLDEVGAGIALDVEGNAYITGSTGSDDFPLYNPIQGTISSPYDAFITKINHSGTTLEYSTYLGGSNRDDGYGIAVDTLGNAYVTGSTFSDNFPHQSAFQSLFGGYEDVFVTKLNSEGGGPVFCTFLGGSQRDGGRGIAVDFSGNAFIVGHTGSANFPTQGSFQNSLRGATDAFVSKIGAYGGPFIKLSASSFTFQGTQNEPLPSVQNLTITNTGGNTLNWLISDDVDWLNVNPSSGNGNSADIMMSVNTSNLAPDTYNATVTISSTNAVNTPLIISVYYLVLPPPELALDINNFGNQFWAFSGISEDLEVQLEEANQNYNITGSMGALVQVDFSNGDPSLLLHDDGVVPDPTADDGHYYATWSPQTLGPVTMTARATLAGYIPGQDVVSGGVYEPVETATLQDAVDKLKENLNNYLSNNPTLAYNVMRAGLDALKKPEQEPALNFAESVSKNIISGATTAARNSVSSQFSNVPYGSGPTTVYAGAVMAAKILYEGEQLRRGNQLQDMVNHLENTTSLNLTDYFNKYPITSTGTTANQAKLDVNLGIAVPPFVPKGYPLGASAQRIRTLASVLLEASSSGSDPNLLKYSHDARLYWRQSGNCAESYDLFAVGSEIPQANSFFIDLQRLSDKRDRHKTVSGICKGLGMAKTAINLAGVLTGGGAAVGTMVSVSTDVACFAQDYFYSDLEFRLETKLFDFLTTFASSWPDQLGSAYELFTTVRSDLYSSYSGDPSELCAVSWRAESPQVCINFVSGIPNLNGSVVLHNNDTRSGSASVAVELAVGDNAADAHVIRIEETAVYQFMPGEARTINYYINGVPGDFARRFSKYFVTLRVLTSGRPLEDNVLTVHRYTGYVTCAGGQLTASTKSASPDNTWILSAGTLAPQDSSATTLLSSQGAVKASITATWPCDSVELHIYDAALRHVGWNPLSGKIDSLIPGITNCSFGKRLATVEFSDLGVGPFRVVMASKSQDSVNYSVSVYEEQPHSAILGAPDSLYLVAFQGDTTTLGLLLAEQGGQQSVQNVSVAVSPLVHATDTIVTSSLQLGTFPTTIDANSFLNIESDLAIPNSQDTGLYLGFVSVTSDAGNYLIPLFLEVRTPPCCKNLRGNANGDLGDAVNVVDITFLVQYLFQGGGVPPCKDEADVNGNGSVNVVDVTYLVQWLFVGGQSPMVCQ